MLRVFLIIDDYNELMYLQTLLKKVGFDVEGLQNQKKYADLSLGFNPQIVVVTARGKKVDGLQLAPSIQKRHGWPKIIALKSNDQLFKANEFEDAGVDQVLETPINPKKLIMAIAAIGNLDEVALLDKYVKIKGTVPGPEEIVDTVLTFDENGQPVEEIKKVKQAIDSLKTETRFPLHKEREQVAVNANAKLPIENDSQKNSETVADVARKTTYQKWIKDIGLLSESHFDRDRIFQFNKKIRAATPPEDISEIEDERKKFVNALFKDKK